MNIILYGAGESCVQFLNKRYQYDYGIKAIVDSAPSKWGVNMCGFVVQNPDYLNKSQFDLICVLVNNPQLFLEIKSDLINKYSIDPSKVIGQYELVTESRIKGYSAEVWDCFPFFNELELLEIRLQLLYEIVDHFIIVEMSRTQRGDKKEFILEKNLRRFESYLDKIKYIKINDDDLPEMGLCLKKRANGEMVDWTLEQFQRDSISLGLTCSKNEDIIIVSDLDEFPDPRVLKSIKNNSVYTNESLESKLVDSGPIALDLKMYMGYLNCRTKENWLGCAIGKREFVRSPQDFRSFRHLYPRIPDSGWHLTWMGGEQKVREKVMALCEGVSQTTEYNEVIVRNIVNGQGMPTNNRKCFVEKMNDLDFPLKNKLFESNKDMWFYNE